MKWLGVAAAASAVSVAPAAWGQEFREYDSQWALRMIGAAAAYERGYTGRGVTVGVVDSGVDAGHGDLIANISPISLDMFTGGPSLVDENGHGTHVAGIIAAARNGRGTHGVAFDARIASLRHLDASNSGLTSYVAPLYHHALDQGVRVFNNSWGNGVADPGAPAGFVFFDAVSDPQMAAYERAAALDSILVWATGNVAADQPSWHAALPYWFRDLQPHWLAVTAVGPSGTLASYANACGMAAAWCLAAPGGDTPLPGQRPEDALIVSTYPGNLLEGLDGTSMAAPFVTGAVAIARQMYPEASAAAITRLILATSTDVGEPGVDPSYGWGLLNIGNLAVTRDPEAAALFAGSVWSSRDRQRALMEVLEGRAQRADAWLVALGGRSGHDAFSLSSDVTGAVLGAERRLADRAAVGAAVYSARSETRQGGGFGASDAHGLAAYVRMEAGRAALQGSLGFERSATAFSRRDILGTSGTVIGPSLNGRSQADGAGAFASLRASLAFEVDGLVLRPFVRLAATHQRLDGLSEAGADVFSLSAEGQSWTQGQGGLGADVILPSRSFGEAELSGRLSAAWTRSFGDDDFAYEAALLGSPVPGGLGGLGGGVELSGEVALSRGRTSAYVAGGLMRGERSDGQALSLGVRVRF